MAGDIREIDMTKATSLDGKKVRLVGDDGKGYWMEKDTFISVVGGLQNLDAALIKRSNLSNSSDLNKITPGVYSFFQEGGIPINAPLNVQRGVILSFNGSALQGQILLDWVQKKFYCRVDNSGYGDKWSDWF